MKDSFKTVIEPFKIKMTEAITMTSVAERKEFIKKAHYNLFLLRSSQVIIDLLTDSGTGTMSHTQWAEVIKGDESYAGSRSYYKLHQTVTDLTGMKYIFPTHQGRASERVLFTAVAKKGFIIPNNTHFDTTRANIEYNQGKALDLVDSSDPVFKGNMDTKALEQLLKSQSKNIPLCMTTITNNSRGGTPVSLKNIEETKKVCDKYNIPLFIDACRFAENAYFIKKLEHKYHDHSIKQIVQKMFSFADGFTMSAKKDAIVNIGGLLCFKNDDLLEKVKNLLILTEGYLTYGGLAGRDMAAIAEGLKEVLEEDYLEYRLRSSQYVGSALKQLGIPIVEPIGAHAIYIDAKKFLPHLKAQELPAQALACELYIETGVRTVEIGTLMFGTSSKAHDVEFLRIAMPRRTYTQSHMDYVIEGFEKLLKRKETIQGLKIIKEPTLLRHFTAHMTPI